jgi:neutral ceramidase
MTLRTFAPAIMLVWLAAGSLRADVPPGPTFRAGFAERDVTPEVGMEAPGGYGKAYLKSVHDSCKVRASVFDDGRSRVAIVGLDALGVRRDTVVNARRAIRERTGIPDMAQS